MFDINYRVNSNNKALYELIRKTVEGLIEDSKALEPNLEIISAKGSFQIIKDLPQVSDRIDLIICTRCGAPIKSGQVLVGDGDGSGKRFRHEDGECYGVKVEKICARCGFPIGDGSWVLTDNRKSFRHRWARDCRNAAGD